ncbi:unnamed protein product [Pedinophyceae sp. YPF-701]|nr:unnamed protein product [Pedinophyceae sp. YPF-701]
MATMDASSALWEAMKAAGKIPSRTEGAHSVVEDFVFFKQATARVFSEMFGDANPDPSEIKVDEDMFPRLLYVWSRCSTRREMPDLQTPKGQLKLFKALDSIEKLGYLSERHIVTAEMYVSGHLERTFRTWGTGKSTVTGAVYEMSQRQFAALMRRCGLVDESTPDAVVPQVDLSVINAKKWRTHMGLRLDRSKTIDYLEFCLAVCHFSLALREPTEYIFGLIRRTGDPGHKQRAQQAKRVNADKRFAAPLLRTQTSPWLVKEYRERRRESDTESDDELGHTWEADGAPAPAPKLSGWGSVRAAMIKRRPSDLACADAGSALDTVWRAYRKKPHKHSEVYRTIWIYHLSLCTLVSANAEPLMRYWAFKQFCMDANILASEDHISRIFEQSVALHRGEARERATLDGADGLSFKQCCAALELIGKLSHPPRTLADTVKTVCEELGGPTALDEGPEDPQDDPQFRARLRNSFTRADEASSLAGSASPSRAVSRVASFKDGRPMLGAGPSFKAGRPAALPASSSSFRHPGASVSSGSTLPMRAVSLRGPASMSLRSLSRFDSTAERFGARARVYNTDKEGPIASTAQVSRSRTSEPRDRLMQLFEEYDALYDKIPGKLSQRAFAKFVTDQVPSVGDDTDLAHRLWEQAMEGGRSVAMDFQTLRKVLEDLAAERGLSSAEDVLVQS